MSLNGRGCLHDFRGFYVIFARLQLIQQHSQSCTVEARLAVAPAAAPPGAKVAKAAIPANPADAADTPPDTPEPPAALAAEADVAAKLELDDTSTSHVN